MSKRTHPDEGPSKRTRFASPSRLESTTTDFLEDDLLDAGSNKKDRRSLKDTSGYESDSTDEEGEGVVPSRRKKGKGKGGEDDDEDEDMFGGSDEEKEGKRDKKDRQEFLSLGDIEGQDFGRKKGLAAPSDDEDDDDDDNDNEDTGSGKKGKRRSTLDDPDYDSEEEALAATQGTGLDGPMAAELTAFNMRNELGEGRMTADGESYSVNDRDPNERYDKWLEGTDKNVIRKARRAKREQEKAELELERREKEAAEDGSRRTQEEGLMRELVGLLERGETVLEGLQRVGQELERKRRKATEGEEAGRKRKLTWAEKQRERKAVLQGGQAGTGSTSNSNSNDMQVDDNPTETLPENPFARLSTLISHLTSLGHLDVYSMTRESLQRMLPAEPLKVASESGPGPGVGPDMRAFEYRFSKRYLDGLQGAQRPVEREIFGPFPAQALLSWKSSGAFGEGCENIELRTRGPQGPGEWGDWKSVF